MVRKSPEKLLHRAVAAYLNTVLPRTVWWTTIPAGGGGKIRGAHLKAMGYRAGTPDILIVRHGRAYWIELKAPKGTESESQKLEADRLRSAGSVVWVCRSIDEVRNTLLAWELTSLERRAA